MPTRGRPPLPSATKALRGTLRKHRENGPNGGGVIVSSAMIAPLDLSDQEVEHFRRIVSILIEQERASAHHVEAVVLLARTLANIERYSTVLAMEGDTFEKDGGRAGRILRPRPEVAMRSDAIRRAQSLLVDLMLTPASATRLGLGKRQPGDFDDF